MKLHPDYMRNLIFGAEDALVSSVGVLFGLASVQSYTPNQLLLTGIVVITVEALSMGAGSFLTEESVHEVEPKGRHKDNTVLGALIMFFSYMIAGAGVLLPYFILERNLAKYVSVAVALILLFLLGLIPAKKLKNGVRMVIVAGLAILTGFFIGQIATI